jgi:outer membrane protein OmpA-like peptidoglycan-associated protein
MKAIILALGLGIFAPLSGAVAATLTADEIATRMRFQAGASMTVNGVRQGVGGSVSRVEGEVLNGEVAAPLSENTPSFPNIVASRHSEGFGEIALGVLFEFSSPILSPKAVSQLRELCEAFRMSSDIAKPFAIIGHTDAVGNAAANLQLSIRRAEAVRKYLIEECAIAPDRLRVDGKGESQLLPDLNPRDPLNRRVEVKISE